MNISDEAVGMIRKYTDEEVHAARADMARAVTEQQAEEADQDVERRLRSAQMAIDHLQRRLAETVSRLSRETRTNEHQ